ncbi:NADH-quinone oxidoreductase subunit M [Acidiferrimicrobium sp. IK]|uniref:complex I subunit 4 family protein n=1 Tax=Acidiferrimicrobium sp. IK TaxID=2871700 RepID=UPI0021CB0118|nr:NADH-quinone oxidoreductase subunit M [Acidiferrimicrobium sp. IK]MCU4185726.1 NADH-quinone oxidoreductase subunit M [Acidiferrimicrobium sp. IK]
MLSLIVFWPAAAALALAVLPSRLPGKWFLRAWVAISAVDLALVIAVWVAYNPHGGFGFTENLRWIPSAGVGYHVGVDGLSLPLVALTSVLFLACAVYSLRETRRPRTYVCLFLGLETVCIGLFVALDLIVFFVFFDLSIVGMYFVIAGWGHGPAARAAALKFFLYTFVGSLALLLGFIGLYLAATPHTFDIVALIRANPLAGRGAYAGAVLAAIGVGLAIKTPTVPFHTWLPPAHTDAPATGSAILAGVLLKMGTYGFVRIAMPLLPDAWRRYALVFIIVGALSAVYGALVALAQPNLKRMIAYTSVNHMGYVILGVGAAGVLAGTDAQARSLAVTGAVTQMVSHGLITGALFLLSGTLWDRTGSYQIDAHSGLAGSAPAFAGLTALAAFASIGIPGFSGFVAEFQIFAGSLASQVAATTVAVLSIVITAGLFLRALQRMLVGPLRLPETVPAGTGFADLTVREAVAVVPLLAVSAVIGVAPRWLLDVIEPAARHLVGLVAR